MVTLTNFGNTPVYEGYDIEAAKSKAVSTGFECTVTVDGVFQTSYSPIGGWGNTIRLILE